MNGSRWEIKDPRSGVVLAHLHAAHFNRRTAERVGTQIAVVLDLPATSIALRTAPLRNPTLVHHGMIRTADWHVLHDPGGSAIPLPLAELYSMHPNVAKQVAQAMASGLRQRVVLMDNRTRPADLADHPMAEYRPEGRRRLNPKRRGRNPRHEGTRVRQRGTQVTVPASGEERIAAIRQIVHEKQYAKVDGVMVDLFSASAIVNVYDALNEKNKALFASFPAAKMGAIAFKLLKTNPRTWSIPNPPRTPRHQRRAVASGRFAKARHYAQATAARGVRRLDLQRRAAFGVGRKKPNPVAGPRWVFAKMAQARYDQPGVMVPDGEIVAEIAEREFTTKDADRMQAQLTKKFGVEIGSYITRANRRSANPRGRKWTVRDAGGHPFWTGVATAQDEALMMAERSQAGRADPPEPWTATLSVAKPNPKGRKISRKSRPRRPNQGQKHPLPARVRQRAIASRGRIPKLTSRRRLQAAGVRRTALGNPRESAMARARRTFRRLNEIEPGRLTRVKTARGAPKVLARLGELVSFRYRSDKYAGSPENPHGKTQLYEHRTQRPYPVLATDPDGREVHIVGGRMHPTPDGLVN